MSENQETPEERRERLRQEELKRNSAGSFYGGGLPDLVGGLGWKGTGILILIIIVGFIIYSVFFR
ncbi:DUF6366 family protein [Virgibacillus ainsalahensis]